MNLRDAYAKALADIEHDMERAREGAHAWTALSALHNQRTKLLVTLAQMPDPEAERERTLEEEIAEAVAYAEVMDDRVMAAVQAVFKRRKRLNLSIVVPDRS